MNPIMLQVVKWLFWKALIDFGKSDLPEIKKEVHEKIDGLLPSMVYNEEARLLLHHLTDLIMGYLGGLKVPATPEVIAQFVDNANANLAGRVAEEHIKSKKSALA